ncbi:MAG: hypothetical protein NWR51_06225 [Akkermansiaceae bacterium]|jgi:hypothetical protein|nr:hypothetical protein [Akkermansiaceae bacterium]MDP4846840.1 hypothetical protein [Akkermansiaceae bacterium]
MNLELPADLQQTADILRNSMMLRSDEKAPALPDALFQDLAARFETSTRITAPVAKISLFEKIQSFISTPAFGMSAAALVILAVALPSVLNTSDNTGTTGFRGSPTDIEATASASIVLIGAPQDIASSLGTSGDFEKGSILTADTASGAKVIVDFNASTITSVSADGQAIHTAELPVDRADLSAAIAEALSKL